LKADDRPIMTAAGVFKLLDNPSSRNNR